MKIAGFDVLLDSSISENAAFLIPPDVRVAIETMEHMKSAHKKGHASQKMLEAAIEYAEAVIAGAAKEKRLVVIKNLGEWGLRDAEANSTKTN